MNQFHFLGPAPLLAAAVLAALLSPPCLAADLSNGYADPGSVAKELRALAGRLPGATIVEYGRSLDGRPLLALQVSRGSGDPGTKPALLMLGGVEPERLATVELALAIAGRAGAVPDSGIDRTWSHSGRCYCGNMITLRAIPPFFSASKPSLICSRASRPEIISVSLSRPCM